MPGSTPVDRSYDRLAVNAIWLLRLRWVAVVGQLITIGVAILVLRVELRALPLLAIVAFTAATNSVFALWRRSHAGSQNSLDDVVRDIRLLAVVMTLDLVSLTFLLYLSGGPANPFVIFYLVNLSLAAVVLPSRWCWALTVFAISCLGGLFFDHVVLPELDQPVRMALPLDRMPTLQELGLIVALAACGSVTVYFITRVTRELQYQEFQLRVAEMQRSRSERLEALATLAAGAGHELASPLSTIAVIAKDLAKQLEGTRVPNTVIEDVGLIRSELDHCRRILNEMSSSAGQATGEVMRRVTVRELIEEVLDVVRRGDRVRAEFSSDAGERDVVLPLVGTAQAIRAIVRNALDASPSSELVNLTVTVDADNLRIQVSDNGTGMKSDDLVRASEPFFTTKEPGQGMGLGLFLAHNVFGRLGGEFQLASEFGAGTTATIWDRSF
ncbi:MAG: HAMP domain-containing sensor histidine kinase [Pirellulaceae bacterium]|nr:HAMP domain-containing sensor histidine kinase [Pirellulaceae bacterium]